MYEGSALGNDHSDLMPADIGLREGSPCPEIRAEEENMLGLGGPENDECRIGWPPPSSPPVEFGRAMLLYSSEYGERPNEKLELVVALEDGES